MSKYKQFSYIFTASFLILIGITNLMMLFIVVLFSNLILKFISSFMRPSLSIVVFLFVVVCLFSSLFYTGREAIRSFPEIADRSFPVLFEWTSRHGLELPFTDRESLKTETVRAIKSDLHGAAASTEKFIRSVILYILALVIAIGVFLTPAVDLRKKKDLIPDDSYTLACNEIMERFSTLYASFKTVMGSQLIIASINTFFTFLLILSLGLPYKFLIVIATLLFGLIPILGNILSNSLIICIALTVSLYQAAIVLGFLVALHKFEYFLNGRIIGGRIENPMWMTLSALILGEYILGISGMILAPVILHYIKIEAASFTQA